MARAEMTQVVMTNKKIGKKVGKFFSETNPKAKYNLQTLPQA